MPLKPPREMFFDTSPREGNIGNSSQLQAKKEKKHEKTTLDMSLVARGVENESFSAT